LQYRPPTHIYVVCDVTTQTEVRSPLAYSYVDLLIFYISISISVYLISIVTNDTFTYILYTITQWERNSLWSEPLDFRHC